MDLQNFLEKVDLERIYQHVLKIECPRSPIENFEKLNDTADYILHCFEEYGLNVKEHKFKVDGSSETFRNIEGSISQGTEPELLVIAHYDSVSNCPGANDNASGVSAMLEAARVLVRKETVDNLRFIGFSLEEPNPFIELKIKKFAQDLGLMDEKNRYTSYHFSQLAKKHQNLLQITLGSIKTYLEAYDEITEQLKDQMTENEYLYFKEIAKFHKGMTTISWVGKKSIMGSSAWVETALKENKKISGVLALDSIGYVSSKKYSQNFPKGLKMKMFKTFNVNQKYFIGNFLFIIANKDSGELAETFCSQCENKFINLPYACFQPPISFEKLSLHLKMLLGSDHAPFWQQGIPGLFLIDTASLRDPYAHTPADKINNLDFEFITKACKASCATIINIIEN